jgi:hypothetical protein
VRFSFILLCLACAPDGDAWISAEVHHEDNADTESFSRVTGAIEVIPKTSLLGDLTLTLKQDGSLFCIVEYTVQDTAWRPDCELCEDAFDVEVADVAVLANLDSACKATEDALVEIHPAIGFGEGSIFVDSGEGWLAVTETWYEDGRTHFEWERDD